MSERKPPIQPVEAKVQILRELLRKNIPTISDLAPYEPPAYLFEDTDAFHGAKHAAGVLLWTDLLTRLPDFKETEFDREALLWSASLHDCGRNGRADDPEHGNNGANKAYELLRDKMPYDSLQITMHLIRGHVPDGIVDPSIPPDHMSILKEADKIDLVRLERIGKGTIDRSRFSYQVSQDVFLPLCEGIYSQVDRVQQQLGVTEFQAYLLSAVSMRLIKPE